MELRGPAVEGVEVEIVGSETSWTMRPGFQAQPLAGARPVLFRGVGDERELQLRVHWPAGLQLTEVVPRSEPWILEAPRAASR